MSKPKTNRDPRMSVNKMAEFATTTNSAERERIIREQKFPRGIPIGYYREAAASIQRYLCDPEFGRDELLRASARCGSRRAEKRQEKTRLTYNARAMQRAADSPVAERWEGLVARHGPHSASMKIEEVKVSVRPEVLLAGQLRRGEAAGAIKLCFSKDPMTEHAGDVICTVLKLWAAETSDRPHSDGHLIAWDVMADNVYTAPRALVRRGKELHAICREIKDRWANIKRNAA